LLLSGRRKAQADVLTIPLPEPLSIPTALSGEAPLTSSVVLMGLNLPDRLTEEELILLNDVIIRCNPECLGQLKQQENKDN
jgi:hypothetical protein